jgi:hypothetical protein
MSDGRSLAELLWNGKKTEQLAISHFKEEKKNDVTRQIYTVEFKWSRYSNYFTTTKKKS